MTDKTKKKEDCGEIVMAGWHLKKEVTITQLVTLVALLVSSLWWASSVETRMSHLNGEAKRIEEKSELLFNGMNTRFLAHQNNIEKALGRIDRSIGRLSDKIDAKADKK